RARYSGYSGSDRSDRSDRLDRLDRSDRYKSSSKSPIFLLSNSGYLYTFNLFFTAFLFTFRPTNYLIRTGYAL
ncbi:hypothetical protein L249_5494, partial [Ophiocordyceps polyrhachis-furcata BCC 54312]